VKKAQIKQKSISGWLVTKDSKVKGREVIEILDSSDDELFLLIPESEAAGVLAA